MPAFWVFIVGTRLFGLADSV